MMGCKRRSISSFQKVTVWVVVITLLWENITLGQPLSSPKLFNPSIPYHIGSIKDVWLSPDNKPPVYIIQDSHANLTAQKNIIKILQLLRGTHIGIEGAKGVVDTNLIRAIPNDDHRHYIADNLLAKGELTGAEYYAGILDNKVRLYGIEEPGLYFQNLRQFRKAVKDKKRLQPYLARWRERLEAKTSLLNKERSEFLDKYISFHEGKISLSEYITCLPVSAQETNLSLYKECLRFEEGLDLDKVDREHQRLLDVIGEKDTSIQFRLGRISPLEYYSFLDSLEWPRDEYPELHRYIQLIKLQTGIDKDGLERELKIVEEEMSQMIQGWKDFIYMNKLLDLRLSPDEVRLGNSNASVFYKTALKRDRVLLKNFLKFVYSDKEPSILITGGFHSEGIAKGLRQRGIPYVIVSPKMASEGRSAYQDLLFNHKDELDRILSHTGRRLAPILRLPHEMALPEKIRVLRDKIGVMQVVLKINSSQVTDRILQLSQQLIAAIEEEDVSEEERLRRELDWAYSILRKELRVYIKRFVKRYAGSVEGDKLDIDFQYIFYDRDRVTIEINVNGLDVYVSAVEAKRGKTIQHLLMERLGPLLIKKYTLEPPNKEALEQLIAYRDSISSNHVLRDEVNRIIRILEIDPYYLGRKIRNLGKASDGFVDMVLKMAQKGDLIKTTHKARTARLVEILKDKLHLKDKDLREIRKFADYIDTACDASNRKVLKVPNRGSDFPMFIIRELEEGRFKDMEPRLKRKLWQFFGGGLFRRDYVKDEEVRRFWERVKPIQDILSETSPVWDLYNTLWQYVFMLYRGERRHELIEGYFNDDVIKEVEAAKRELTGKGKPITPETIAELKGWAVETLIMWMRRVGYILRQFTWRRGKGSLSNTGQTYFIRGSQFAEEIFGTGRFQYLDGIAFRSGENLVEVNLDERKAEINPILVAILQWIIDKDGKKDRVEAFYRFLFHHEDLHGKWRELGPATSEFMVQTESLSNTSPIDLITIRDLINYILDKKEDIEKDLGKDIFQAEDLLAFRDLLNLYIGLKLYNRISEGEFLLGLGEYIKKIFPDGDLVVSGKVTDASERPKGEIGQIIARTDIFKPLGEITAGLNRLFYELKGGDVFNFHDIYTRVAYDPLTAHVNAREFYNHIANLDSQGNLPERIVIHEYGPGNGRYAGDFLDEFKRLNSEGSTYYYERIDYILIDISEKMLRDALVSTPLYPHRNRISTLVLDASKKLPFSDKSAMLVRFNELYDDLPDVEFIQKKGGRFYRLQARLILREGVLRKKDGTPLTPEEFMEVYYKGGIEKLKELDPIFMEALDWELGPNPPEIDLTVYPYGDFIREFTKWTDTAIFPINHGAIAHLRESLRILDAHGYIQSYDYGFNSPGEIIADPIARNAGSATTFVNFALLRDILEQQHRPFTLETQEEYLGRSLGEVVRGPKSQDVFYHLKIGPVPERRLTGQPLGVSSELGDSQQNLSDYNGLDYVVISDNPGGVEHRDGLGVITEIRERFNFILTIATKRRSLEEIKERILAGYKLGVKNFLIVSGDLPGDGPDSIQAIQYLKADRSLPSDIRLGAVENPFSGPSLHERVMRLEKKIQAGADFIITQPVFDLGRFRAWMKRVRKKGLHRTVPIWAGFMPVRDRGLQKRLAEKLSLHLPAVWFSSDMQENYREILEGLVREEGISGIHIMPLKGIRRLTGYSEVIRSHPAQSVIGRFDLERARKINRIEELGFEQINKLRIEGDSVLYKRDGGLLSYPVVLLRAPLNSKPSIDALVGILDKLDLDRFNLKVYLYKEPRTCTQVRDEEAPIPTPHHPGLVSGQKGEGASPYVLDFNIYDYTGENISSGFRDYLNEVQLEINYRMPWWYKALLGVFWFFSIERLYKIPFLGCIKCGQCVLSTTAFICIMRHCAKQMRNGPCGDLLPDGKCRLGSECAWHKIHQRLMRWKRYSQWFERRGLYLLANFFDREPLLMQILAPWDKGLSGTSSQLNALRGIIKGVEFFGRPRAALRVEIPGSRGLARDIRRAFRHGGYLAVLDAIDRFHNSKERIIADIKSWEERLKQRKKDLDFREKAHRTIEGLVYKFYSFVHKDDFKPLREILKSTAVPSGEKIWDAFRRITPIEVLDGVTGVIGEMSIGAHLRETVENINRLIRFSEEDRVHFVDLQPEYLTKLKESMDTILQSGEDKVILYLASILHDYGMFLRNYGTNSHAVDGERLIKPLIDRLVQNGIITQEQGEIILALIGGHVLIRVALGYIPPRNVFRGLIDLVVQERFLRCLRIMYFSDCAATPLFQSVDLMNEMARRTIKYTDRETISNLDRLRLLSGGKDIGHVEPWLAEFLDRATFDMPTEVLVFMQLEPEILVKFLYYLNELRRHLDVAPDFLFVVNNDSSRRITSILSHLDFSQINTSLFPAHFDKNKKQIVVQIKEEAHLPIEREGDAYTERGELLVMPTPVLEIDRSQLEKLDLPDTDELLKAIKKVISFYKIYGERDVSDYWVDIRKGLKRPLTISGRTITIDIDLLKIPSDYLFPFLLHLAGHEGGHSLFTADHLYEREEEAIVLFIDALRFSRHTRRVQDAIIGAFRSLKGLKDTRYIEFLEGLREDPGQDLAELIKTTLGIDTRYLEMRIFKNGESPVEISGIDELFSSFKYQKVRWSLVVTRKEYYGQVRIRKKVVLFDERGHLITDEGRNGIEFQYGLGLNSMYWNSIFLKPEHQRHGLGAEFSEKIEEIARLNTFGEEYPSVKIELTPKEGKRGYWERLGYRGEAGRRDVVEKRLDINRDYFGLAQRIVPLIIPHIDPDAVSQNLPKEGPWDGKKYTHAELLYFIAQDSSGSVASVILDAILSRIGLESLLGLPDIDITPSEKTLLQTRLKQLNLDEKNQVLNDILDSIYLRSQRFVDYIPRANAVIRLEDFKERLSQYYLLVDIARLDDALARKLIELRKQGRIARIIWSSYDIADEELIRDRLDAFEEGLYNIRDIVIPRSATDYTDYIKDVLRKNRIPMDRLIIIATEENYDAVYRHIGEVLRDVKLSLTAKEFNFLIPHLPRDIVDRFKLAGDRYLLELDPLEEDPRGLIEGLEEAQRELAKAA